MARMRLQAVAGLGEFLLDIHFFHHEYHENLWSEIPRVIGERATALGGIALEADASEPPHGSACHALLRSLVSH